MTAPTRGFRQFLLVAVAMLAGLGSARAAEPATKSSERGPPAGRKVILVTGSTNGLGREVARQLAASGAHVIVHGRSRERGLDLVAEIERAGKGSATFHAADLASLAQVREFGELILREYPRLDVLINNAGIWLEGDRRELSADGHEMHFAVNYLSGYLLTRILLPRLIASAPSRIVNVASGSQAPLDFADLKLDRNYSDSRGYSVSKLAQVMATFDLARELKDTGVSVNVLHPASLMPTKMVLDHGVTPQSSVAEGAEAVLNLVTSAKAGSGQYFEGLRPARANRQAYDAAARERLARISRELTGPFQAAAAKSITP